MQVLVPAATQSAALAAVVALLAVVGTETLHAPQILGWRCCIRVGGGGRVRREIQYGTGSHQSSYLSCQFERRHIADGGIVVNERRVSE